MTFYSKLISELGRGPLATNKLPRSTSDDLLLIDTSDSSSGLLLITIGFLLMLNMLRVLCHPIPRLHIPGFLLMQQSNIFGRQGILGSWLPARYISNESVELKTDNDVVRFSLDKSDDINSTEKSQKNKKVKMSKKAKVNELRFYRLKAKKKMNSPNPEVRIRYKLEKAKRKEAWLIEKLRKYDVPKPPPETFDPEILTEEERHYLKRTGDKKKHYVPVGRRGVFGGVVLNMHLHWKNHETVKVICKPCRPGQVHEYAEELARLSKGIVIDIKPNNTIIFYRGKNYAQPEVMSPPNTLSKAKALEKYRFGQSLEHTSHFIERLEKELEEYHQHLVKFGKGKEDTTTQDGLEKRDSNFAGHQMSHK
ncbi:RNA-binding [Vigna unguiculata]|uniref:RNA-binding n=1 Tax=Vigna unguiculata TaxID=3917 RepID=A0A4D6NG94_VIGUN|nr:RNA-binding [Vigna unguiculata]